MKVVMTSTLIFDEKGFGGASTVTNGRPSTSRGDERGTKCENQDWFKVNLRPCNLNYIGLTCIKTHFCHWTNRTAQFKEILNDLNQIIRLIIKGRLIIKPPHLEKIPFHIRPSQMAHLKLLYLIRGLTNFQNPTMYQIQIRDTRSYWVQDFYLYYRTSTTEKG